MSLRNIVIYVLVISLLIMTIGKAPNKNNFTSSSREDFLNQKDEIIEDATAYLESCQRENGSYDYPSNINTTAEACAVLDEFSDVDTTESKNWLESNIGDRNTDILSRTAIALDDDSLIDEMMEVQNTDGGLGLSGDYTSDILDSVLALESINASSSAEVSSARWQLLCYIARQMNSDGSFSYTKNSDSDVALDEPNRNAFVSEDFYRMVKDNNLKGFKFEPIENISSLNKKYQYELSYFNYNEKIDSRDYKEIINNYKYAIEAFDISESDNFGAIEKIHTIVNESDYSSVIPDKYDDITKVSIGLGVLFGQFICDSYGVEMENCWNG